MYKIGLNGGLYCLFGLKVHDTGTVGGLTGDPLRETA